MIVTSYGHRRLRAIIVGVFAIATLMTSAAPAVAKHHHARKPSQLWKQYPLNVKPTKTPGATPSAQPSPTSPASVPTVSSHLTRDVRPRTASTGDGMLLAAVVVVLLALAGIVIAALRRKRQPAVQRSDSLRLPLMPWNQPGLRRQRGRSRHPRNRRSAPDDSLRSVPPEGEPYATSLASETDQGDRQSGGFEPETDEGDANAEGFPTASEEELEEDDALQTSVAEEADGANEVPRSVDEEADSPIAFQTASDEDDDAGPSEPPSDETAVSTPPSDAGDGEASEEIAGDRQDEESEADPGDADAEVAAAPSLFAERERVIVKLADGRSLEGWKRVSGSGNESLLILDVITAFDNEGNHAPTTRADSFILRSEITSIIRIDDS